jgi:hypothetical protein
LEIERVNLLAAGTPQDFKAASNTIYNIGGMEDRSSALLIIDVQIGLAELVPPEVQSSVLSKIKTLLTNARSSLSHALRRTTAARKGLGIYEHGHSLLGGESWNEDCQLSQKPTGHQLVDRCQAERSS